MQGILYKYGNICERDIDALLSKEFFNFYRMETM
jgi:hypothetical protein